MKVDTYSQIISTWSFMTIQGQGNSLKFAQGQSDSTFQTFFPKTTQGHLKPNFIWSLHGILRWKFVYTFRVTWPGWLPGPYLVKTFKYLLLRNQEADDFETWYTTSGTQVLPNVFKLALTIFMTWSNLFPKVLHGWKFITYSRVFPSLF